MRQMFILSLIFAGFVLSFSKVLAQSKFALSATVAPFYTHYKTNNIVILPDKNGVLYSYMDKSKGSWRGSWFGLNGRYSFSSKWSASTGLWFNKSIANGGNTNARSHNFSIPVMVNFQTSARKLSPYFSAGALWNFETTTHLDIADVAQSLVFKSGDRTFKTSMMAGAGGIYNFSKHLSVIGQPTFSYIIPPSGYNARTYQLSFNVQLLYKL